MGMKKGLRFGSSVKGLCILRHGTIGLLVKYNGKVTCVLSTEENGNGVEGKGTEFEREGKRAFYLYLLLPRLLTFLEAHI